MSEQATWIPLPKKRTGRDVAKINVDLMKRNRELEAALLQERNGPIVCMEHRWGNACPWCALHANNAEIERLRGIVSHQDAKLVEGQSQSETACGTNEIRNKAGTWTRYVRHGAPASTPRGSLPNSLGNSTKRRARVMDLFKELDAARLAHDEAKAAENEAQRVMTEARNRLNKAQKAIDKGMSDMKAKAPWNTEWHDQSTP